MEWFFEMYFVIYNNGFRFVREEERQLGSH